MIPRRGLRLVDLEDWSPDSARRYQYVRPAIKRCRYEYAMPVRCSAPVKSVLDREFNFITFVYAHDWPQIWRGKSVRPGGTSRHEGVLAFGRHQSNRAVLLARIDEFGNWQRSSRALALRGAAAQDGDRTQAALEKSAAGEHSQITFNWLPGRTAEIENQA
jgi:hypothetical protein